MGCTCTCSLTRLTTSDNTLPVIGDHLAMTATNRAQRAALAACKAIANEVVRIVGVLFDVVPGTSDLLAIDVEQVGPGVATIQNSVARHHAGERPEGHPVAGVTRSCELMGDLLADVGQSVVRFN